MNLLKKITLSLCFVTLIIPSYSYSYYLNYFYEKDYSFDKDLSESIILLKNRLMLPYNVIKRIQYEPQNLYGITNLLTSPSILLMLGGYYYYQLNQNSKAQQLMIEQLKAELEKQKQTENQPSGIQTEDKSDDPQDAA